MTRVDLGIQVFDTDRQINISPDPFRVFVKTDIFVVHIPKGFEIKGPFHLVAYTSDMLHSLVQW